MRFDRSNLSRSEAEIRKALKNLRDSLYIEYKEHDIEIRKLGDPLTNSEMAIIQAGKWLLRRKYGRLDVSLKKPFILMTLFSFIPLFFVCDYFFGLRIVDVYGSLLCLIIAMLMYVAIGLSLRSRCENCRSYFSLDEKPLKTSDLKHVSQFIPDNEVKRIQCEVCGQFHYRYRPKTRRDR